MSLLPAITGREPYYQTEEGIALYEGDCIQVMRDMPANSVDSIVTDPPYGLGFMGRKWDALPPGKEWAEECLRVLKPGGHIVAFGGSRTWHRLAVAIEDAGFEIRDSIAWLYGSGFPKSHDVSKAIDREAGAKREVIGRATDGAGNGSVVGLGSEAAMAQEYDLTAPATPNAEKYTGWGSALKPGFEPAVVGRKPLDGTLAHNMVEHGVGGLNIDATRIGQDGGHRDTGVQQREPYTGATFGGTLNGRRSEVVEGLGRWPVNVAVDPSQAALMDLQRPETKSSRRTGKRTGRTGGSEQLGGLNAQENVTMGHSDAGGPSRFFPTFRYVPKAGTGERPQVDGVQHPTVKPLELMRWLVRLVTPENGIVLEPFSGSGTTLEACVYEDMRCIGIEWTPEYLPLIVDRLTVIDPFAEPEPGTPEADEREFMLF